MTDKLLIIFVRNPVLGKVKTRLAATLGDHRALDIYQKLLAHTNTITRDLPVEKVVYYSEFVDQQDSWEPAIYQKKLQTPGTLGDKMKAAFQWGFDSGYQQVCIIGSDCRELSSEIIMEGFESLDQYHAVLGPSRDGGYYLLGLNQFRAEVFEGKQWSTDSVATDTLADFRSLGWSYSLLQLLNDVDEEQDLLEL
jgi:rSAM/selenodomain-associated transferase 1